MSHDGLVAKTPSIIFQPGGVSGGLIVTTWAVFTDRIALNSANLDAHHGLQDVRAGARFAEDL